MKKINFDPPEAPAVAPAAATPAAAPAAAPADPPAPADLWAAGTAVTVHGLQGAKQHNGKRGKILRYNRPAGRYEVELESGEKLKIKPVNLEQTAAGDDGGGGGGSGEKEAAKRGGGEGDGLAGPSDTTPQEPPKERWDKGIEDKWWRSLFAPPEVMAQAPDTWDQPKPPPPPPPPGAPPDWGGEQAPWDNPDSSIPRSQYDEVIPTPTRVMDPEEEELHNKIVELFESLLEVDGERSPLPCKYTW